ncbi:MAG: hypothetical protein PWQ37_2217 [Candidatus Petromonas sp.]|jgi:transcriptional regulator with PAS, ATPase and Fis domain|nr:hypothetical protein [Candidatus Petromonas sp.]
MVTEKLKRFLRIYDEFNYKTILLFNREKILYTHGIPVEFRNFKFYYEQYENCVIRDFPSDARVSFHHEIAVLWIKEKFDENYGLHLKLLNLFLENTRLQKRENIYFQMIQEIGDVMEMGVLFLDEHNKKIYENKVSKHIELEKLINEKQISINSTNTGIDEVSKKHLTYKIFRKAFTSTNGNFFYAKKIENSQPIIDKTEIRKSVVENTIIGQNSKLIEVLDTIDKIATIDSTVLIRGESGVGKEQFAKLIHDKSHRANQPFVAVNCASIPENLLESELFGYEKGSFTGALKSGKIGKFEAANNGTLFLDEIGDMSLNLQAKILRVLQEKVIEKVGGIKPIKVDVRIISATHQNLEDMIKKKEFRKDLFYRLNVIPIYIPPLRERTDDIENIIHYYIKKHCIINNKPFKIPSKEVINILKRYRWPGNIRELMNIVEYIVSTEEKEIITTQTLPREILNQTIDEKREIYINTKRNKYSNKSRKPNKQELIHLLDEFGYSSENKKQLAEFLGISLATLYRWLKKYDIT